MLQRDIEEHLQGLCDELLQDLGQLYEPFWDAPNNNMRHKQAILDGKVILKYFVEI